MSDSSDNKSELTQKQSVFSFFDKNEAWQGELYDALDDYQSRLLRRRRDYAMDMLEKLPTLHRGKALDIGCGSGAYLERLLEMGFEVTGVDISEGMLEASRRRLGIDGNKSGRVHLALGDIESLPLPDAEFDLVICIGVVGYLFLDDKAQLEIHRVLKPGGCLLLYLSNIFSLSNIDFLFRQKLRTFFKSKLEQENSISLPDYAVEIKWAKEHEKYFYKAYNPWKYERVMAGRGFKLIDAMTFGFESRLLRRSHLIPARWLDRIELLFERLIHRLNIPYLSYSGWMYMGAFIRM
ncbi:MAG: methyltransferase domain-containing protein [Candidatus Kryptoniota bacterium]